MYIIVPTLPLQRDISGNILLNAERIVTGINCPLNRINSLEKLLHYWCISDYKNAINDIITNNVILVGTATNGSTYDLFSSIDGSLFIVKEHQNIRIVGIKTFLWPNWILKLN